MPFKQITLLVDGMSCPKKCSAAVHKAICTQPGVMHTEVSFPKRQACVQMAEQELDLESGLPQAEEAHSQAILNLIEVIGTAGFVARVAEILDIVDLVLVIEEERLSGPEIETVLKSLAGVQNAKVDLPQSYKGKKSKEQGRRSSKQKLLQHMVGAGRLFFRQGTVDIPAILAAVESLGMKATVKEVKAPVGTQEAYHELLVEGMMCQKNCGSTVRNALRAVSGANRVEACFEEGTARVWGTAKGSELVDALVVVGFGAKLVKAAQPPNAELRIEGMKCQKKCASKVSCELEKCPGVTKVLVSFPLTRALVWGQVPMQSLIDIVKNAGYEAIAEPVTGLLPHERETSRNISDASLDSCRNNLSLPKSILKKPTSRTNSLDCPTCVAVFNVRGMSCAACVRSIEMKLGNVTGVVAVKVALLASRAEVRFDPSAINENDIAKKMKGLGYQVEYVSTTTAQGEVTRKTGNKWHFKLQGLSDSSSASKIEKELCMVQGVTHAVVALANSTVTVTMQPNAPSGPRELIQKFTGMGFSASLKEVADDAETIKQSHLLESLKWRHLFITSIVFTLPLMIVHMWYLHDSHTMYHMGRFTPKVNNELCELAMWVLATPVQFYVGAKFYRNSFKGLLNGTLGMDFLIAMGTSAAYFYSVFVMTYRMNNPTFTKPCVFDTSAMLLMFVTMGKLLESSAKGRTSQAITALMDLRPDTAFLVTSDNENLEVYELSEISLQLVQPGDILKVLAGARIPTDGEIIKGESYVDESIITGESMPVHKKIGSSVYGSTVNQFGVIYVKATSVGSDTALAQIIHLVQEAQTSKAPIQEFADKVAGVFVPCVLLISLTTMSVWLYLGYTGNAPAELIADDCYDPFLYALLTAISVLVVACPCALGLATPTAVMVGTGVGASNGILIKNGKAFETAKRVTTVVFDKTGTLTAGKPVLTNMICFEDAAENVVLQIAGSAECDSEHPVGKAILCATKSKSIDLLPAQNFVVEPGRGVKCQLEQIGKVLVGNRQFMTDEGISISEKVDCAMARFEDQGKTSVCVAAYEKVIGIISVADVAKPEARMSISALREFGVQVWMLTGDNARTAEALAREVGITRECIKAGMLPAQKAEHIKALQSFGYCIAMVGDGINDSPALAQADLGIAIGAGTQVAVEAASMVLIRNNLKDVYVALHLSRTVFNRIRLNFVWAFGYNLLMIPFAAGLLIPIFHATVSPQIAALAMAFSSTTVVFSSLLLRTYQRPKIFPQHSIDDVTGHSQPQANPFYLWFRQLYGAGPAYSRVDSDEKNPLLMKKSSLFMKTK